jgi:hypothetical protein
LGVVVEFAWFVKGSYPLNTSLVLESPHDDQLC